MLLIVIYHQRLWAIAPETFWMTTTDGLMDVTIKSKDKENLDIQIWDVKNTM